MKGTNYIAFAKPKYAYLISNFIVMDYGSLLVRLSEQLTHETNRFYVIECTNMILALDMRTFILCERSYHQKRSNTTTNFRFLPSVKPVEKIFLIEVE